MSPTATLVTAEPTSWTQPAFSWPRMYGSGVCIAASHWPSMMCRSVRHTPAPPILTMTSRGPLIFGSGTSSMTGASWNLWIRTAFTECSSRSWNLVWPSARSADISGTSGCGNLHCHRSVQRWLGCPAVRVADLEHAGADGCVRLDAGPGDPGLTKVKWYRCGVDLRPGGGSISSGESSLAGRPSSARRSRSRLQLRRRRDGAEGQRQQLGRRGAGGDQRAADLVGAGHHGLAQELGAQVA